MSRGAFTGLAGLIVAMVAYPVIALTYFRTEDPPGLRSGFAEPAASPPQVAPGSNGEPSSQSPASTEITVDAVGPLRIGLLVSDGDEQRYERLLEVAADTVDEIVAAGGVAGRGVELIELRHDADQGVEAAYRRAQAMGLDVVVGPVAPGVVPAGEFVHPDLPLVSPADYFSTEPVEGWVRPRPPWRLLGAAVDDVLGRGTPTLPETAILVLRDELGTTTAAAQLAVTELSRAGVATEVVTLTDAEASGTVAAEVVAAGAGALVLMGVGGDTDQLLTSLVDAGLDTSVTRVVVVGDLLAPTATRGSELAGVASVNLDFWSGRSLAERYQEGFISPEVAYLRDSLVLVAVGASNAAPGDGAAMFRAIVEASRDGMPCVEVAACFAAVTAGEVDVRGLTGPIELDDDGLATVMVVSVVAYDAEGRVSTAPELLEVRAS